MAKERKYNQHLHPEFVKGVVMAACLAQDYEGKTEYRLEDVILLKLNVINKRQMRKKKL